MTAIAVTDPFADVYFNCGHQNIIAQDCEIALAADIPFYIRHECPDYRFSSLTPDAACGKGKFYCCETKDGPFLEHLHQQVIDGKVELQGVENGIAQVVDFGRRWTAQWDQHGVPMQVRQHLKEYKHIHVMHTEGLQKRNEIRHNLQQSLQVIEQAKFYYEKMNEHLLSGASATAYPPFVPSSNLFGKMPAEMAMARGTYLPVLSTIAAYPQQVPAAIQQSSELPPSPPASGAQMPPPRSNRGAHHPGGGPTRQISAISVPQDDVEPSQHEEIVQSQESGDMQPPPSTRKRGRQTRRAPKLEPQSSLQDDAESMRRSTRVRNKKVNYSEPVDSRETSREPSPDKSDASGFSPAKSDERDDSISPSRSITGRNQSSLRKQGARESRTPVASLSERLNDWARQSNPTKTNTPTPRRAMPGVKDLLNSSPAQNTPMTKATMPRGQRAGIPHPRQLPPPQRNSGGMPRPGQVPSLQHNPGGMKYSTSDPNILGTKQQQRTRAPPSMPPQPAVARTALTKQTGQPAFFGLETLADSRAKAPLVVNDWFVQGQYVQEGQRAQLPLSQPPLPRPSAPYTQQRLAGYGPTFAAGAQTFGFRRDSLTSQAGAGSPASQSMPSPAMSNYANLRRSFSTGTTLTPPTLPSSIAGVDEPRKRSRTPSNAPPNKRMRLSLPGEDSMSSQNGNTDWLLGQGMQPPRASGGRHRETSHNSELPGMQDGGSHVTPAPKLAPTAMMSAAYHGDAGGANAEGNSQDQLPVPFQEDTVVGNEQPVFNYSDQIDWGQDFEDDATDYN
ncbi:hypothetical protein LTR27_010751 [Elasticomyces elasticus]|nr:hypothetical protein LTR27_010751 [Elasticomyces elasticus]